MSPSVRAFWLEGNAHLNFRSGTGGGDNLETAAIIRLRFKFTPRVGLDRHVGLTQAASSALWVVSKRVWMLTCSAMRRSSTASVS